MQVTTQMRSVKLRKNSTEKKNVKVYGEIWTRSILFHAQEPKHLATTVVAAGSRLLPIKNRQTL